MAPARRLAFGVLALWLALAALGPWLTPLDPNAVDAATRLRPPGVAHPFGTDQFGRDVFSRVVAGARYALAGVLLSTALAAAAGAALGVVAGDAGGLLDAVVTGLADVWLALPSLLFAIAIAAAFGPSFAAAMLAIGFMRIPSFVRVVRASTAAVRRTGYVEAARALGLPRRRIVWRHVLPNVAGPLLALAGVRASTALLAGSALGFVGLGAQIPEPEWGALVAGGRPYLEAAWWISGFPCLAIVLIALALLVASDALRDRFDPGTIV